MTPQEIVLDDTESVFVDYIYICDLKFVRSEIGGIVADLKKYLRCNEVRRCDIFSHEGAKIGDNICQE